MKNLWISRSLQASSACAIPLMRSDVGAKFAGPPATIRPATS